MEFSIQQIINEAVVQKEQRIKKSWWATDLGKCLRGVYFARQGIESPQKLDERTLRVFSAGNLFEEWIIDTISKYGNGIKIDRPETIYLPEFDLSVRPDLIITKDNEQLVYELKSVHSRKFWWMEKKKEGPDEHYLMQLWLEMYATKINEGRLIYFSKDDLCVAEYGLSISDPIGDKVKEEIQILNEAWKNQEPPEAAVAIINNQINWKAKYCPYHTLCMGDDKWLEKAQKQCLTKKSTPIIHKSGISMKTVSSKANISVKKRT